MSVEDGAKVFEQQAFQEPANAYEEARRGAYNPTYLSYTFGKLQIQDLRPSTAPAPAGRCVTSTTPSSPKAACRSPWCAGSSCTTPRGRPPVRAERRSGKSALIPSGAFRKASQFVTLDVPGANSIVANGINGAGLIVGIY